jgi:uncharacterized protein YebE (UPF0316 family)
LSIVNVVLNTIKSIVTVNGGKLSAALINAITFFVYTYVIIYTNCELPMFTKALITAIVNFIGVYAVKWIEEKARKDKLWKVEMTVPTKYACAVDSDLRDVPHSYITISPKHTLFNFYCATQSESQKVKDIANQYEAKYFVAESKTL